MCTVFKNISDILDHPGLHISANAHEVANGAAVMRLNPDKQKATSETVERVRQEIISYKSIAAMIRG